MKRLTKKEREVDRQYRDGYRRKPESASVGKTGEKLAAEVWPKENWEDIWKSWESQQSSRRRKKPPR